MSDPRNRDTALQTHELGLRADRTNVLTQSRSQILNEGSKGLTLINGGGAVALTAFLQAVWTEPTATEMRQWILAGIACLILGTAFSAIIFFSRYLGSFNKNTHNPLKNPWWWIQVGLTLFGLVCFLAGMSIAVIGSYISLNQPYTYPI